MTSASIHDVEAQAVTQDIDTGEIGQPTIRRSSHLSATDLHNRMSKSNDTTYFTDQAGQCCFLCLRNKEGYQYAVQVFCIRPTRPRCIILGKCGIEVSIAGSKRLVTLSERFAKLTPKERACESDADIYQRLTDTCYRYQGPWKRWIPFYGITNVREVNFQFVGRAERDGKFPIIVLPVAIDKIRENADGIISKEPSHFDIDYGDVCYSGYSHSSTCSIMMEMGLPCLLEEIKAARLRKKKLSMLYLLRDCARNPCEANGLRTLVAQGTCILETDGQDAITVPRIGERYDEMDTLPGLEFDLGWQIDRIAYALPSYPGWTWLCLSIIWFCVIAWGGTTSNWPIAISFGQLLAACLSVLISKT